MDLIYTDVNNIEQGVISGYDFDIAFGSSENSFSLTMAIDDNFLEPGCHIYVEGTEYGGIVDSVEIDTDKRTIVYGGRTWHGILEKKVIIPPKGEGYLTVSGDANIVLATLIENCGLGELFDVVNDPSGIEIHNYSFRYDDAYSGIKAMLFDVGAKLKIQRVGKYVMLSAVTLINYATSEEWDVSDKSFKAKAVANKVNHIIALGTGDLEKRHVIHLFADRDGNIQPYSKLEDVGAIFMDKHYILNTSKQVLFGKDEIIEVLDYPSAESTESYHLTDDLYGGQPSNWASQYDKYYTKEIDDDGDEEYNQVGREPSDVLEPLTKQPSNWAKKYGNYYTADDKAVEGIIPPEYAEDRYIPFPKSKTTPIKNWKRDYAKYYFWDTDGVVGQWSQVRGVDLSRYEAQIEVPDDWGANWGKYKVWWHSFKKVEAIKYVKETKADGTKVYGTKTPEWAKNTYYTKGKDSKGKETKNYVLLTSKPKDWDTKYTSYYKKDAMEYVDADTKFQTRPKWQKKKFFTARVYKTVAPKWDEFTTYATLIPKQTDVSAPTFEVGKYYKKVSKIVKPTWMPKTYYELKVDHYAELVKSALERLEKYANSDSIDMTLPDDGYEYDINDIVGATAEVTGFEINPQPITKKIVKINNQGINISYEIGGK